MDPGGIEPQFPDCQPEEFCNFNIHIVKSAMARDEFDGFHADPDGFFRPVDQKSHTLEEALKAVKKLHPSATPEELERYLNYYDTGHSVTSAIERIDINEAPRIQFGMVDGELGMRILSEEERLDITKDKNQRNLKISRSALSDLENQIDWSEYWDKEERKQHQGPEVPDWFIEASESSGGPPPPKLAKGKGLASIISREIQKTMYYARTHKGKNYWTGE